MIGRRIAIVAACGAVLVAVGIPAVAQEVSVQAGRGPHYTGDTIRVQVTATGFEEEPVPDIHVAPPKAGRLEFAGVSPSVSTSIRIQNGQVDRTRDIRFVYEYRYVASVAGDVFLGPFEVIQGATVGRGSPIRLRVTPMASSDDIGVELALPASPVYVGARLPVVLVIEMTEDVEDNLQSYSVDVPFFASSETFRFLDPEAAPDQRNFKVDTGSGTIELPGTVSSRRREGRSFVVVEIGRTLVPLQVGVHAVAESHLVVDEVTRWRRDLFGRPQAGRVRKLRASAPASKIRVEPLPQEGKPASFAGAVGRGFELEVAADRTVVAAGEPIELELTLRGDGLYTASLPPLDAEGLLPPEDFRVPGDFLSGTVDSGAKRFTTVVRVLHEGVKEIPPLEYAWFDPETASYVVTRSRPIALSVGPAERVGAAAVRSPLVREPARPASPGSGAASGPTGLGLTGADLAIERDPTRLARGVADGARSRVPWLAASYGISMGVVLWALWDSRRRRLDPDLVRRRRRLAQARQRVERAAGASDGGEIAGAVASALREMIAESPDHRSAELDAFIGDCDARSYAPAGSARDVDEAFLSRARELARAIEEGAS